MIAWKTEYKGTKIEVRNSHEKIELVVDGNVVDACQDLKFKCKSMELKAEHDGHLIRCVFEKKILCMMAKIYYDDRMLEGKEIAG